MLSAILYQQYKNVGENTGKTWALKTFLKDKSKKGWNSYQQIDEFGSYG